LFRAYETLGTTERICVEEVEYEVRRDQDLMLDVAAGREASPA
jgi:hypothetical protein